MNEIIEKQIVIKAKPQNVWRVFIDPETTKKMGGSYISDWKIGSFFGWKNNNGEIITHGEIMEIETEKILKHKLFNPDKKSELSSVITYKFIKLQDTTILTATEELYDQVSKLQFEEINQGWDFALDFVKNIAEEL